MNTNENKDIENHEPTILEELKDGMHKDLESTYIYEYTHMTEKFEKPHEETIGILIDRFRRGHNVNHTMATRCVNEMLWEHCGTQTLKKKEESDDDSI